MQHLIQTLHPALIFDPHRKAGRYRRNRYVHLHRGVLDQASGPYCLWNALVILGYISEEDVNDLSGSLRSRFGIAWRRSAAYCMHGIDYRGMRKLLCSLGFCVSTLELRGSNKRLAEFTAMHIRQSQLVLLSYVEEPTQRGQWILAVGIEEFLIDGTLHLSAILCVDPSRMPNTLVSYNARIERDVGNFRYMRLHYLTVNGVVDRLQLACAFALIPVVNRIAAILPPD